MTRWDIILKEAVIYGGAGRQIEPRYLVPLIWYHAEQLNINMDDNTFVGLESIVRLNNRFALYVDLLLDDYQIENKTASDREPGETGLIAGADIFDFPFEMGSI